MCSPSALTLCADFQRAWKSSTVAYNACLGSHAPSETRFPLLCAGQLRSLSGSAVQELREKHPRLQELQERWAAFLRNPLQELKKARRKSPFIVQECRVLELDKSMHRGYQYALRHVKSTLACSPSEALTQSWAPLALPGSEV